MALYPKKLRSLADIEQERRRLLKKKEELGDLPFLSAGSGKGKADSGPGRTDGGGILGMLTDVLPMATTVAGPLIGIIRSRLARPAAKNSAQSETAKSKKHLLYTVAREFVGGYLKWKAIELSVKGVRKAMKHQKDKRAAM